MAIVTNKSGKFYDVDDNVLEKSEVKGDELSKLEQPGKSGPPAGAEPSQEVGGRHHWHNCWHNCC